MSIGKDQCLEIEYKICGMIKTIKDKIIIDDYEDFEFLSEEAKIEYIKDEMIYTWSIKNRWFLQYKEQQKLLEQYTKVLLAKLDSGLDEIDEYNYIKSSIEEVSENYVYTFIDEMMKNDIQILDFNKCTNDYIE